MNGYVTPNRFSKIIDVPISFAQTELRRGKFIVIAQFPLATGQMLQLRVLTLSVIKNLTPGTVPAYSTTSLGAVSAGLYFGSALTSPIAVATTGNVGVSNLNPFYIVKCMSPGVYTLTVSNNTTNMDFAASVTGAVKYYL